MTDLDIDDVRNLAWAVGDEECGLCNAASRTLLECAGEIERLRLTDKEREAIEAAAVVMDARNRFGGPVMFRGLERATTLRGLLERLG